MNSILDLDLESAPWSFMISVPRYWTMLGWEKPRMSSTSLWSFAISDSSSISKGISFTAIIPPVSMFRPL